MYSLEFKKIYEKILYYKELGIPQRQQKSLLSANSNLMSFISESPSNSQNKVEFNLYLGC